MHGPDLEPRLAKVRALCHRIDATLLGSLHPHDGIQRFLGEIPRTPYPSWRTASVAGKDLSDSGLDALAGHLIAHVRSLMPCRIRHPTPPERIAAQGSGFPQVVYVSRGTKATVEQVDKRVRVEFFVGFSSLVVG